MQKCVHVRYFFLDCVFQFASYLCAQIFSYLLISGGLACVWRRGRCVKRITWNHQIIVLPTASAPCTNLRLQSHTHQRLQSHTNHPPQSHTHHPPITSPTHLDHTPTSHPDHTLTSELPSASTALQPVAVWPAGHRALTLQSSPVQFSSTGSLTIGPGRPGAGGAGGLAAGGAGRPGRRCGENANIQETNTPRCG